MSEQSDWYYEMIEELRERTKNRIPCKECKYCGNAGIFGVCNNEKSEAFKQPVRFTTTCPYAEREP